MPVSSIAHVSVRGPHDLVRNHLHFFVHFIMASSHEALDRVNGILGVGDGLTLCHLAHEALSALRKCNDGRRCASALLIGDDHRLAIFHDGNHRVGRAQIDSDNLAHELNSLQRRR